MKQAKDKQLLMEQTFLYNILIDQQAEVPGAHAQEPPRAARHLRAAAAR